MAKLDLPFWFDLYKSLGYGFMCIYVVVFVVLSAHFNASFCEEISRVYEVTYLFTC